MRLRIFALAPLLALALNSCATVGGSVGARGSIVTDVTGPISWWANTVVDPHFQNHPPATSDGACLTGNAPPLELKYRTTIGHDVTEHSTFGGAPVQLNGQGGINALFVPDVGYNIAWLDIRWADGRNGHIKNPNTTVDKRRAALGVSVPLHPHWPTELLYVTVQYVRFDGVPVALCQYVYTFNQNVPDTW